MTKPVQLIVIGGFAGSGKSTLSSRLGRTVGMPVIDLDIIVHALQKSKDFNGGPGAFFDVCVSRVADRVVPHDRVAVTAEELEEHRFKWEYITNAEIPDAIRIDATKSPESVFQEVVRSLGNRG